ncbi:hypothetical protein GTP41_01890 [Pseudoduganella sp. DS3]|uniref:MvdD-like pre-ATP grasp domain-containing protein n=1 Tax=Pseudoduganella guangdongensis TaxID=2692179 RepID=A0A6N9HCH5_9BURK|nr:hypothetical protein [Pseudoduganella guangdongensis]MYN00842.1 hypothetical protein [Pseudoduganella guangdongensis]
MHSVFIPSMIGDTDSIFVKIALENEGARAVRMIGDNFPTQQTSSLYVSDGGKFTGYYECINDRTRIAFSDFDVVWLRRPRWPRIPNNLDPRDGKMAKQECDHFVRSVFFSAWDSAVWVNSMEGRRRANSKLLQLREAVSLGFPVPTTLVSNNPNDIREFLDSSDDACIVKPILGTSWIEDGRVFVSYTSDIAVDALPADDAIRACPSIYQKKIVKEFEVRIVFFGKQSFALKLHSQDICGAETDWRIVDTYRLNVAEIVVPDSVHRFCVRLMTKLKIVHGSFDFAVDSNGNWVFFEVNEAGQFLWMETLAPQLPILDAMTQFLLKPSDDFVYIPGSEINRMTDVAKTQRFSELLADEKENEKILTATSVDYSS